MSRNVVNFSAGPAGLPTPALERARDELLDYQGTGASIMEQSHRGEAYDAVHHEALGLVRSLLDVPDTHDVLFMQGGATGMFGLVPMNFLSDGGSADYIMTGVWSDKALSEAQLVGRAREAGSGKVEDSYLRVPKGGELDLDDDARYVHYTSNNTIAGTQFHEVPQTCAPLVCDMSSDIMARPIEVARYALIYAGAQKNLGPSGVTMVIARRSFLESGSERIPTIFRFIEHARKDSLLHTPPTFAIYLVRNVLDWIREEGGLETMQKRNAMKARALYACIDQSDGFFRCPVDKQDRSQMNVVFRLPDEDLEARFVTEAEQAGLIGLKGHRSVGGIRASLYNAVSMEGVSRLIEFMDRFVTTQRGRV